MKKQIEDKIKKIEFSKIITVAVLTIFSAIAVWSIVKYYNLVKLALDIGAVSLPDSTLPVTCITTILGAIISYVLYQFGLKNSRNKYGVDSDGQPFKQKVDYQEQEPEDCDN